MTTTLRPTAPEQRGEDGGRSRTYDVCVNGRPVGRVDLATDARFGPSAGRISHLAIDPADRHRGRGTVAALAAEEVLRGWGCVRVEISVPAPETEALALAAALGYQERGRNMSKRLGEVPSLPAGSEARPMAEAEYGPWFTRERVGYIRTWVDRGVPEEQARAKADRDYAQLLPEGWATPGTVLRVLAHRGADVGTLWVALDPPQAEEDAYVFAVEVAEEHRGHGHGRALMRLAEAEALAAGARTMGLFVFADNTPAVRLYESLGFRPVQHYFNKPLV
ncbi:GNAT family N-acetyltransferase [Streptomyces palmae]|uniref:GNAT family N-acetyltransferase n=1 Tax=Streptomyces palmae TaxID=1701085 RepID=A0A4Z0GYR9_9ACTN|nr:GNAT family N-acetyltransferase [Streptomyces palmae]TGB03091.1 GNAT family N-acetyltransferase [Streptomyces palmae]